MAAEISANSRFRQTREFSRFELSFGKLAIASLPNNDCSPHALDYISMPSARLHDDCAVGLTTKLATQPIKCKFALVGNCQELLWKFTNAKKGNQFEK